MALGNPNKLESEVIKIFIGRDAESLEHAYGIIELNALESKNSNRHFLFCNFVKKWKPEKMVAFKLLKRLYGFLSKLFKTQDKTKGETLLSKQNLFVDVKQPSQSKIFVSNTIKDKRQHKIIMTVKSVLVL